LANLGDCRAVKFQFSQTHKNTINSYKILNSQTHRPQEEEARIETAGGWVSSDGYILGVLSCSRAFGDREMKHYDDFQMSSLKRQFEVGKQRLELNRQRILQASSNPASGSTTRKTRPPFTPTTTHRKQSIPKSNMKFLVSPTPEIEVFQLEPNDALLVIGSDGLWDFIKPIERWVEIVNEAYGKRQSLEDVCEALVNTAKAKSSDDITVVVISLVNNPNEQQTPREER